KSAQIREILINESAWEEMTCLFAPSLGHPFIYTFYEIMGSLTKYRLSVILYGRKDMRLILQIPKVESL
ncbi:hypothetical protein, partial [Escherichia coli]|uniref:hypothetical protein n=1 Tax=Escherichia coli TaxID=562 RepID=UPI00226F7510